MDRPFGTLSFQPVPMNKKASFSRREEAFPMKDEEINLFADAWNMLVVGKQLLQLAADPLYFLVVDADIGNT